MADGLAALPPTDGPVVAAPAPEINIANQDPGVPMEIIADHPDLAGITAQAVGNGDAWCDSAAKLWDSPQGAFGDGYQLGGDHPAGADGDWADNMMFAHEGPP